MDESERQRAVEHKRALKDLTESKGWQIFVEYLADQAERRVSQIILNPLGTEGAEFKTIYQQEFGKGEVAAFKHAMAFPKTMIESLKDIVESTEDGRSDSDLDADEPDTGFDPDHVVR